MSYSVKATSVGLDKALSTMDVDGIRKLLLDIKRAGKYSPVFYQDNPTEHNKHIKSLRLSLQAIRSHLLFLQKVTAVELQSCKAFLRELKRLNSVIDKLVSAAVKRKNVSEADALKFRIAFGLSKPLRSREEIQVRREFRNIEFICKSWKNIEAELAAKKHCSVVGAKMKERSECGSDGVPLPARSRDESGEDVLPEGKEERRGPQRNSSCSHKGARKDAERQQMVKTVQEEKKDRIAMPQNNVVNLKEYFEQEIQAKLAEPACSSSNAALDCAADLSHAERKARYIAQAQGARKAE